MKNHLKIIFKIVRKNCQNLVVKKSFSFEKAWKERDTCKLSHASGISFFAKHGLKYNK